MTQSHNGNLKAGTDDVTGRAVVQPNGRTPPMSPHLQVWRWHITMMASILFRVTIGAISFAALFGIAWLASLALGAEVYGQFLGLAASPLGLLIGFGLTVVLFSFILNGTRHLLNDATIGLDLKSADMLSRIAVWGPVIVAVLFWIALFATGRVSL